MNKADLLLDVIRVLATSPAVTDTIWMPGCGAIHTSATDVLAVVASELGSNDEQIELACAGLTHSPLIQGGVSNVSAQAEPRRTDHDRR